MRNLRFQLSLITFLISIFSLSTFARADFSSTDAIGYTLQRAGVTYEVFSGEYETEEELEAITQALTAKISEGQQKNAEAEFKLDLGYLDEEKASDEVSFVSDSKGRKPASADVTSKRFINRLSERLARSQNKAVSTTGIKLNDASRTFKAFYLKNSKLVWTFVRVSVISKFEYVGLISGKVPRNLAIQATGVLASACGLTAYFNNPINDFQNEWRFYKTKSYLSFEEKFKKFFNFKGETWFSKALKDPKIGASIDVFHNRVNFGIIEALFGLYFAWGQQGLYALQGYEHEALNTGEFLGATLISTVTQGQWEAAIGQYKKNEVLKGVLNRRQIDANRGAISSIGSVISVVGYAMVNANAGPTATTVGYGLLASLGAGGYVYKKILTRKEAMIIRKQAIQISCEQTLVAH